MRVFGVEHVAIAVRELDGIASILGEVFGLERSEEETVAQDKVRVVKLEAGNTRLELVAPSDPSSAVSGFLDRRGPGLHHLCLQVEDLDVALRELRSRGVRLIDESPREGANGCRIAFIHPKALGGVLVELAETAPATESGSRDRGSESQDGGRPER